MDYSKLSDSELLALEKELAQKVSTKNNTQLAFKIKGNSAYGAVGNAGFRYFELPMAEAITLTGQFSDRHMEISLNKYLNKVLKTENVDYIIYGDTDSLYINVDPIVKQFYPDHSIDETVIWLDKFAEKAIQPIIDKSIDHVFSLCNCKNKLMDMKREAIASAGIFCKKKKYGMLAHNSEGVDYKPYKMKVMGLDIVKSSTPKMVREDLKDCMKYMFTETESKLQKHVLDIKTKFMAAEPEDIAFPRGVSDLNKYTDNQGKYQKGCPIHVRAAALYNMHKDKNDPPVRNGDKIKFIYLKLPNPIKEDVIGFPTSGTMPMRDALTKYIDWNAMWEKTFISPLEGLTDAIGWQHTKTASLEDFFC